LQVLSGSGQPVAPCKGPLRAHRKPFIKRNRHDLMPEPSLKRQGVASEREPSEL